MRIWLLCVKVEFLFFLICCQIIRYWSCFFMICSRFYIFSFFKFCMFPCHFSFSRIFVISLFELYGSSMLHSFSLSLLLISIWSTFAIPRIAVFRLFVHFRLFICFSSSSQIGFVETMSSCATLSLILAVLLLHLCYLF